MKKIKKYWIQPFYIHGLKDDPIDRDFNITPCLVCGSAGPEITKDKGFAYAIGIKWGFIAIGFKFFGIYKTK